MQNANSRKNLRTMIYVAIIALLLLGGTAVAFYLSNQSGSSSSSTSGSAAKIQVVAAENFWGSLASQLGGNRVNVTSIVSDPNVDPHQYESNPANARSISDARLVIVNGAGYDTWAQKILGAESTPNQIVLNVQQALNLPAGTNPHFWYSPYYVNDTVGVMYKDLVSIDPSDSSYFKQQYYSLNSSLWTSYMSREAEIKQRYGGTPVAATEDIFVYVANASGLDLVSPPSFMQAVAEGNDPAAQDVATFQRLLQGGNSTVHVLVYNEQTVTPLTQNLRSLATQNQIPITGVTETIQPAGETFQAWMGAELILLQDALNAQALGK